MKKFYSYRLFIFLIISVSITGCSPYWILTGCIKDDFTVKFDQQNIQLLPDVFFNINDLKLTENNFSQAAYPEPGSYKSGGQVSYKISILRNGKTYYGRIAFYSVPKQYANQAVASFYKIYIPESYFQQAKDGAQACFFEYCKWDTKGSKSSPTWVIWFSDTSVF